MNTKINFPNKLTSMMIKPLLVGALLASSAYAVDGSNYPFALDGNADSGLAPQADWQDVLPLTGAGETFIEDEVPPLTMEKFFTGGGSKDDNDIPSWRWVSGSSTRPDKDNITTAYAKAYSVDHDGNAETPNHLVIYFGADRFANDGDAQLGFWFFKNSVGINPNGTFSGTHSDDDLLVQVNYIQGGKTAQLVVYKWQSNGSGDTGSPKKVLKTILNKTVTSTSSIPIVCTDDDSTCLGSNLTSTSAFWPYTPKSGAAGVFPPQSFFEGGIDITALIGNVCFSSFMAETRSSQSATAQLKDFALGDFNLCGIRVSKACSTSTPPAIINDGTAIRTTFDVNITNIGFGGSAYDVQLTENIDPAVAMCKIAAIDGNSVDIAAPQGVAVPITAALNSATNVTVQCDSTSSPPQNPLHNSVSAVAGSLPGRSDLTASHSTTAEEECGLISNPQLLVTKTCKSVMITGGSNAPKVCVQIQLDSQTSEQLRDVTIRNTTIDGTSILARGLTLNPHGQLILGDDEDICYTPSRPDDSVMGVDIDPEMATYSDTVEVFATGAISGRDLDPVPTASAHCHLCPPPQHQHEHEE